MRYLLIAFLASLTFSYLFIKFKLQISLDPKVGIQKFHKDSVPRIGGLAIFIAFVIVSMALYLSNKPYGKSFLNLIIVSLPIFIGGFLEDITKKISPKIRLLFALLSAILAVLIIDADLKRIDVVGFDYILANFQIFSIIFTAFALSGISNAFNIIDGFNGLASGVSIIIFLIYAYVSFVVGDEFLLYLSLIMVVNIFGFFLFNFPFGKIFLGDGGGYLIGFISGIVGILLVNRNPEVSAWFVLMVLAYPVVETIFTIYRRKFLEGRNPLEPDISHLHTLIYKRIICKRYKEIESVIRNSLTSLYLWGLQIFASVLALLFWQSSLILIFCFIIFCLIYVRIYFNIARLEHLYADTTEKAEH